MRTPTARLWSACGARRAALRCAEWLHGRGGRARGYAHTWLCPHMAVPPRYTVGRHAGCTVGRPCSCSHSRPTACLPLPPCRLPSGLLFGLPVVMDTSNDAIKPGAKVGGGHLLWLCHRSKQVSARCSQGMRQRHAALASGHSACACLPLLQLLPGALAVPYIVPACCTLPRCC